MATSSNRIRAMDMPILDQVFEMGGGYVLNFNNRTFASFFAEELGANIDDPRWSAEGDSKAKRLRFYLRNVDGPTALKTLEMLWEYREATEIAATYQKLDVTVQDGFKKILARLGGKPKRPQSVEPDKPQTIDESLARDLAARLLDISTMKPHPRGFAFEKFLKSFFDAYGLSARASLRLVGEQIDGSLELSDQTYLLEAKWTNAQVDAQTLRAFNAKVEDKAKWSRGLIISQSGFTQDGLTAFGKGKSVICMDGLDLHETLTRRLDFAMVLSLKARHAAETGNPFISVRDLRL